MQTGRFPMPNLKRTASPRLLQVGEEWSVQSDDKTVDQLSESMAWEFFLSGKSVNSKLFRSGKVMASRDFSSPIRVQRT
jgi:hypothetical protein